MLRTTVFMIMHVFLLSGFSLAGTVDLPKTGQRTCYDENGSVIDCAGTGQDGEIQSGVAWPEPRFIDNNDGTITDMLTGLMWLKDANCFGLMGWWDALTANPTNYSCQGYTANYDDWRLPNIIEIESLTNAEKSNMAGWLNSNGFINVQTIAMYWSSTPGSSPGSTAWLVSMWSGEMWPNDMSAHFYVWKVRGTTSGQAQLWKTGQTKSGAPGDDGALQLGISWPAPRFSDKEDGTIIDNLTGLVWLKDANCFGYMHWQNALETVKDFNVNPDSYNCQDYIASYTDWRLPNRKELHSLTDFSQHSPPLPPGHLFTNTLGYYNRYWSSTTFATGTNQAWIVDTWLGSIDAPNKTSYVGYVWPVRNEEYLLTVEIDIKPRKDPNYIITKKGRLLPMFLPVAILSTDDFYALEVDKASLTFGRTGEEESLKRCARRARDVNHDGYGDLVCFFWTNRTGFQLGHTEGILKGQTADGMPMEGHDAIEVIEWPPW